MHYKKHKHHHVEYEPLYTKDGVEVPYPYIAIPKHKEPVEKKQGITYPQIYDDTLVFRCENFSLRSRVFKHGYDNIRYDDDGYKVGIHRKTDNRIRKQVSEYYLEEIRIKKIPLADFKALLETTGIPSEFKVYSDDITVHNWLPAIKQYTSMVFCTAHGERFCINLNISWRNLFILLYEQYSIIHTSTYRIEPRQEIYDSIVEFIILCLNKMYHKYNNEIYNFIHGNQLDTDTLSFNMIESIYDKEKEEIQLKFQLIDGKTGEKIIGSNLSYKLDEQDTTPLETEIVKDERGKLNTYKIRISLGENKRADILSIQAEHEDYKDTAVYLFNIAELKSTNIQFSENNYIATRGETINIPITATDHDGKAVNNAEAELYIKEEEDEGE